MCVEEHAVLRRVPLVPVKEPAHEEGEEAGKEEQSRDPQSGPQQVARFGREMGSTAFDQSNLPTSFLALAIITAVVAANDGAVDQHRLIPGQGWRWSDLLTVGSLH